MHVNVFGLVLFFFFFLSSVVHSPYFYKDRWNHVTPLLKIFNGFLFSSGKMIFSLPSMFYFWSALHSHVFSCPFPPLLFPFQTHRFLSLKLAKLFLLEGFWTYSAWDKFYPPYFWIIGSFLFLNSWFKCCFCMWTLRNHSWLLKDQFYRVVWT